MQVTNFSRENRNSTYINGVPTYGEVKLLPERCKRGAVTELRKSARFDKELVSLLLLLAFPASVLGAVIAITVGISRNYVFLAIIAGFLMFVFALVRLIQSVREAATDSNEIAEILEEA